LRAFNGLLKVLSQLKEDETVFLFSHGALMKAVAIYLTDPELSSLPESSLPGYNIHNGDMILIEIPRGASIEEGHISAVIHSNLQDIY
jgi:hypothetical protein